MSVKVKFSSTNIHGEIRRADTEEPAQEPLRLCPPSLYQAYCRAHFLEECSVYHSLENARFAQLKAAIQEAHPARPQGESKEPTAPTRVQPSRAKKRMVNTTNKTSAKQVDNIPPISSEAQKEIAKLDKQRTELGLDLPQADFIAALEKEIVHTREKDLRVSRSADKGGASRPLTPGNDTSFIKEPDPVVSHPNCPFGSWASIGCRYCDYNSQYPRTVAPVAPMHFIRPGDFDQSQYGEFGAIEFAVDICGADEKVILSKITTLDGSIGEVKKPSVGNSRSTEKQKPAKDAIESASVRSNGRKRDRSSLKDEADSGDAASTRKRRKIRSSPDGDNVIGAAKAVETPARDTSKSQSKRRKRNPSPTAKEPEDDDDDDDDVIIRKRRRTRMYKG